MICTRNLHITSGIILCSLVFFINIGSVDSQDIHRYRASHSDTEPYWAFPCRCVSGCDIQTGECVSGTECIPGQPNVYSWEGRACRFGNVAYNKRAFQSGTYTDYYASRAVDGGTSSSHTDLSCALPYSSDPEYTPRGEPAWWYVDLEQEHVMTRIYIYTRNKFPHRMTNFYVTAGNNENIKENQIVHTQGDPEVPAGTVLSINLSQTRGRYVGFYRLPGSVEQEAATLCEVVVIGREVIECSSCPSSCDDFNGCSMCPLGIKLPNCETMCSDSEYGDNCEETCSSHCAGSGQTCHIETGICTNGCDPITHPGNKEWYLGDRCDIHVPTLSFEAADRVNTSPEWVTATSVTWRWREGNADITADAAPYIGYIVQYKRSNTWINGTDVLYNAGNDGWQEGTLTGLELDTQYQFRLQVYRRYTDGQLYISIYSSDTHFGILDATTLSNITTGTSGWIIGTVVGVIMSVGLVVVVVILVVVNRKMQRKQAGNQHTDVNEPEEAAVDDVHIYDKPDQAAQYGDAGHEGPYQEIQLDDYENIN